jgi:hypothetical protein
MFYFSAWSPPQVWGGQLKWAWLVRLGLKIKEAALGKAK